MTQTLPDSLEKLEPIPLRKHLFSSLKKRPKRIVFTEGEDVRVLKAPGQLVEKLVIAPILLGNKTCMKAVALVNKIDTTFTHMLTPTEAAELPLFCERLDNFPKYQDTAASQRQELLSRTHKFSAMIVQYGQADGIVAGANSFSTLIKGLERHATQVPVTASVDMIIGTDALVACESVKYRELYPED